MGLIYTKRVYTRSMRNTVLLEVVALLGSNKISYSANVVVTERAKVINSLLNWRRVSQPSQLAHNSGSTRKTLSLDSYLLSAFIHQYTASTGLIFDFLAIDFMVLW